MNGCHTVEILKLIYLDNLMSNSYLIFKIDNLFITAKFWAINFDFKFLSFQISTCCLITAMNNSARSADTLFVFAI